jgi:hypothetical protein
MKLTRILLLILMAALMFGGSFTCSYNDGDGHHPTTLSD